MNLKPLLSSDAEVARGTSFVLLKERRGPREIYLCSDQPEEKFDGRAFKARVSASTLLTFNGSSYDLAIYQALYNGLSAEAVKKLSDDIIVGKKKPWQLGINIAGWLTNSHIDLMQVAPGRFTGLKVYGGRIGAQKLQDLPFNPDESFTEESLAVAKDYCENDCDLLFELYDQIREPIELRVQMSEKYGINLLSESDQGIAERVLVHEAEKLTDERITKPEGPFDNQFFYTCPPHIHFTNSELRAAYRKLHNTLFHVTVNGQIPLPEELKDLRVSVGETTYQLGLGGLHSTSEKNVYFEADEEHELCEIDAASFYPYLMIAQKMSPDGFGDTFQTIFPSVVADRIAAKRAGDVSKAASLKIVANATFGKLNSPYSRLYSPRLMVQTTITGQLTLLMLIEMLEQQGHSVVSANTDGIVVRYRRKDRLALELAVWNWEQACGLEAEETQYAGIYFRDVNSYLAFTPDQRVKRKGEFSKTSLMNNPKHEIVTDAITQFIWAGVPLEKTIRACSDIKKFVVVRSVKEGAVDQAGNYLGKTLRWYYGTSNSSPLLTAEKKYKVPMSEGASPVMTLPKDFPNDVDFDYYVREAKARLAEIGIANDAEFVPLSLRSQKKAA